MSSLGLPRSPLIAPGVALCGWTLIMEVWLYALRIPALQKSKLQLRPEMTKTEMNSVIPASSQWAADNFAHLCEQPTQFYATLFALVQLNANDDLTVGLAWGYVGLRVLHSLVQATANPIMTRFRIFALSSLTLAGLTVRAVQHLL
ncbi:membrane-associated, eicosanoid/glutathione metabolism protein [Neohortaea acidophila]|uniref:Membrane-associated, eicosanoid/glutathione metabolism protein n=1 Tax=Neohortaea acidophila TaxID=245834 RepID=A0A6A6Q336_9PEZI|nr:membrane-associated, eicosanoid/glutathione metabolism protein [Neohortaea acidophila]KAF2486366.1 membrane-associated, eicosanoid/glutathione metabolism protein [Neohortaea acidophila]